MASVVESNDLSIQLRNRPMKMEAKEVDYNPKCPHCDKEMREVHWQRIEAFYAEFIYMCPHCRKALGIGASR